MLPDPLLKELFDDILPVGGRGFNRSLPPVNIFEDEQHYQLEFATPGYDKADFTITIEDNMLNVSATREEEKETQESNFTRREFGLSSFSRSFNLPSNTASDDIEASYKDGILRLTIRKKGKAVKGTMRKISVE